MAMLPLPASSHYALIVEWHGIASVPYVTALHRLRSTKADEAQVEAQEIVAHLIAQGARACQMVLLTPVSPVWRGEPSPNGGAV